MRGGLRFATIVSAAGLMFGPAAALAQSVPDTTTNAPAPDTVGPRELQNFSLPGTATKPAEQSPPTATPAPAERTNNSTEASPADTGPAPTAAVRRTVEARRTVTPALAPPPAVQAPVTSITASPPAATAAAPSTPSTITTPAADAASSGYTAPPEHRLSILPWLAAALVLAAGTLFLLWRRRPREALADGAELDLFVAPEPAAMPPPAPRTVATQPAPSPRTTVPPPAPPTPRAPVSNGIVAARLRPALEINVQPRRCLIEDDQVTIEFDIDLLNAGTAPARGVLAEASLLNASAAEGQELAAFFANPVGAGERIETIAPMKQITLTSQVVAPRSAIEEYELGGRRAFVPVLAFNALYEWSGGKGQTSAAYLVGKETRGDKLGPFRFDGAPRDVRNLGARPLPAGVRI
jgi:hypothetical protein